MTDQMQVWIDQDLCTGDGLCVQYAPEVFEFDIDGLAYVKNDAGDLLAAPGQRADVPSNLRLDVISSAKECPGDCIHVVRAADDVEIAGPDGLAALRRAALPRRRGDARRQPAGADQERGVADHPVLRTHRQPDHVPAAHERLPGRRLGEPAELADRLHQPRQLGGRRDVADRARRPG